MATSGSVLAMLPARLRARGTAALPDRLACARDLWQRHLLRVQQGEEIGEAELPAAVVRPETAEEVAELVALARREGIDLVPYGAGSGVCGAIACGGRTLVVDTKLMRSVRRERADTLCLGPGVLGILLEEALAKEGATLGHFPSSILCSTVGGWVAARGAGQCSGRYGKIEDMVVSASAVLGDGTLVTARRRDGHKSLLPLLVGSEGTLGIFTELELRLHPAPAERGYAAFEFSGIRAGMAALRELYQAGLRPAVARLYDPLDTALVGNEKARPKPERAPVEPLGADRHRHLAAFLRTPRLLGSAIGLAERTFLQKTKLVLVFEGARGEAVADAAAATVLALRIGGRALGERPARAWHERRYAVSYEQSRIFRHAAFSDTFEVAAPWSRLEGLYENVRRALGKHVLVLAHLSHAYPDGCSIYFTFLGATPAADPVAFHEAIWRDALAAALDAGGTMAHHHGVGRLRSAALARELGPGGIRALANLKRAWDPAGILCPRSPLGAEAASDEPDEPLEAASYELDAASALVRLPGSLGLAEAERRLDAEGRTLGLDALPELDIDGWIGAGMPGLRDPFLDPVEQRLAGFSAALAAGGRITLRPAPRRATGPDLAALFVGAGGRLGRIEHAWLRAHSKHAARARPLPFGGERAPAVSDAEAAAWQAVERSFTRSP